MQGLERLSSINHATFGTLVPGTTDGVERVSTRLTCDSLLRLAVKRMATQEPVVLLLFHPLGVGLLVLRRGVATRRRAEGSRFGALKRDKNDVSF